MTKRIEYTERGILLPPEIDDLTRREFLIGAGLITFAPACGSDEESGKASGETRTVEHALGTTEVPVNPERIVAVDLFAIDTMLALGAEAVGVRDQATIPRYMARRVEGVESVGDGPNLEAVAALDPDLILTLEGTEVYDELSQIAPTVAPAFFSSSDWKDVHLKYAEALGMEEDGRKVLGEYETRARELGDSFGDPPPEISILRVSEDYLSIYLGDSFPGTVVRDAGLSFPENQTESEFSADISRETLSDVEADAVFLWSFGAGEELAETEREALEELREDPLFRRLDVVRSGDVYVGGDHWIGSGVLAANLVLDDLEEALGGE